MRIPFSYWWNKVKEDGSFAQNYAVVLSGTGLNIGIQVFVTPILTRLYTPEAYGVYSLFLVVSTNLALIASLRLPQAIMLPKAESEFRALIRIGVVASAALSFFYFVVLFFLKDQFLSFFNADKLIPYYYLIPVMTFLVCMNQYFGSWQYRNNLFKKSVAVDTSISIGVRGFNLAYGFLSKGTLLGLVFGDMLGKVFGLILSWKLILKERIKGLYDGVSKNDLLQAFKTYRVYPFVNLPGVWLEMFSGQLPVLFLSFVFGLPTVGMLSLAVGIMDIPKRLFAYSATSAFYKKAVDVYESSKNGLGALVTKTLYFLLAFIVIPYSVIMVFGKELFAVVLGGNWAASGSIARYLAMYYVIELLCVSLGSIFYVLRKEKVLFRFQVGFLFVRLMVLMVSYILGFSVDATILALSIANVVLFSTQLWVVFDFSKLNGYKYNGIVWGAIIISVAFMFGLRFLMHEFGLM
ncbi:MAG: oligosaccharide flippase family protein [Cyclobacteriaceae bacterium]|nr:oligosaccharide flippase family protein [Cyclobacteriaceae bacterium]MCB0498982.1 oligosaccharide flippase family protein [Cyclobacteriaceae bacterium]MCB9238258.1 oligosaccharide flippase family protein [Flammeovirgaceae bacterium]MCO5272183.1 oligosaccharide flippase family protein [Cyclobacteriaceae bacterium]MCW5902702.1 oligosaccharide flippase family protein [Cyclobacteriaceae bacterium]